MTADSLLTPALLPPCLELPCKASPLSPGIEYGGDRVVSGSPRLGSSGAGLQPRAVASVLCVPGPRPALAGWGPALGGLYPGELPMPPPRFWT